MTLFTQFFQFFFCVTSNEKIWDNTLSSEKQGHLSWTEWREKAATLRMIPDDGMLNYRSTHVHAYIGDDGSHAGRPSCRVWLIWRLIWHRKWWVARARTIIITTFKLSYFAKCVQQLCTCSSQWKSIKTVRNVFFSFSLFAAPNEKAQRLFERNP